MARSVKCDSYQIHYRLSVLNLIDILKEFKCPQFPLFCRHSDSARLDDCACCAAAVAARADAVAAAEPIDVAAPLLYERKRVCKMYVKYPISYWFSTCQIKTRNTNAVIAA
jgi:hypothetical protein